MRDYSAGKGTGTGTGSESLRNAATTADEADTKKTGNMISIHVRTLKNEIRKESHSL